MRVAQATANSYKIKLITGRFVGDVHVLYETQKGFAIVGCFPVVTILIAKRSPNRGTQMSTGTLQSDRRNYRIQ